MTDTDILTTPERLAKLAGELRALVESDDPYVDDAATMMCATDLLDALDAYLAADLAIAKTWPASRRAAEALLAMPEGDDTRSEFRWVRFANGDLALVTFPHDETYFSMEPEVVGSHTKATWAGLVRHVTARPDDLVEPPPK